MLSDKEVKQELRKLTQKEPEKFFAVDVLKSEGFKRYKCSKCGRYFWSVIESDACGEPSCSGGFRFIGKSPAKYRMNYIETWKKFAKMFEHMGYTPIARYPVAARWRTDTDFVRASIYDFQPYVVSGEIEPPANPLVIPQFCLRFNDIDNVGITGAHYSGFVMIGQHAFMPPERWNQKKYFLDIYTWLVEGLGLKKEEIMFHEDAWAGGGNAGACIEYFSRGLELGNQVYMTYEITEGGLKKLRLNVLDMGMGHERNTWFSNATSTSYDSVFPETMKKLYKITGFKIDEELMRKFLPYASYLNVNEISNVEKVWNDIAKKISVEKEELKKKISASAALYSIGEHSRSLLFAISDGVLPSNVAGGYNLRIILRRALSLIEKYSWNISLPELCEVHAKSLKEIFPEVSQHLNEVSEILEFEKSKFSETRKASKKIVESLLKKEVSTEKLIQLYDSQGINPEFIKKEFEENGRKLEIPENFYTLVAEIHGKESQKTATKKEEKIPFGEMQSTKGLYFGDYKLIDFKAKVLKIVKKDMYYIVLDKTAFYPTSGGQLYDTGTINSNRVAEVFKQDNLIVHALEKIDFKEGDVVTGKIDFERRKQLAQHHTAAHIVNAAARIVLGNHIWQAGASKTLEHARLDITHYKQLAPEEIKKIETVANKIVKDDIEIKKFFLERNVAEKKYGFRLYQGGAVPGKQIRIVEIPGIDVEACGGTHLNRTSETGRIKILKTTKIQDGIVRIEFASGEASEKIGKEQGRNLEELSKLLKCCEEEIPGRVKELFEKWKSIVKKKKLKEFKLESKEKFKGTSNEIIKEAANMLKTQPEYLAKTIKRFLEEIEKALSQK